MSRFLVPVLVGWLVALTIGEVWLFWYSQQTASQPFLSGAAAQTGSPPEVTDTVSTTEFAALQNQVQFLTAQIASQPTQPLAQKKTAPGVRVASPAREVMITLGSAATTKRDWTGTAAEVRLDPSKYGQIIRAHWEAAGSIVGGELAVRLVDVTNGTTYYDASLVFNTSTPTWKQSTPIVLANNAAVYRLEIKSSSGELGQLQDSRLVIETQ